MSTQPWTITIDTFDGLGPAFWENAYPKVGAVGNVGHASALQHIDLFDPSVLTQGSDVAALTNGDTATTLLRGITRRPRVSDGYLYGVGGAKLYQLSDTTMTSDANFPHTINKAAVTAEDGEDCVEYQGNVFYSYNHSGTAGDVGRLNSTSTFDDDYMSTVPTGGAALVGGVPHQMIVGGDDVLYITNGRYVATLSATTFTAQKLDLPTGEVISSITWNHNRILVASNFPAISATEKQAESSIYFWDTTSSTWEYQIRIMGQIGALYTKNGVTYVWYRDATSTGGYKLGYVAETQLVDLAFFTGSLPTYYQVSEWKNHLVWVSDGKLWAWGAPASSLPTKLFQFASGGHATVGGLSNGTGSLIIGSTDGASAYRIGKLSGYETDCNWKSMLFDVAKGDAIAVVKKITVFTEPLGTGARLDLTLQANYGGVSKTLEPVQTLNETRHTVLRDGIRVENFRLDLSFTNGSASNPVKVRKIIIDGYYTPDM